MKDKQFISFITEIRKKGQITLPKAVREMIDLDEGDEVVLIPLNESIIFTKRRYSVEEIRKKVKRFLKSAGISPEELLDALKEERKLVSKELYDE